MKKFLFLALLIFISKAQVSNAQVAPQLAQPSYPFLFKDIPHISSQDPKWVHLMYSKNLNDYKLEEAYQDYYENNAFQKTIHTQNYKYLKRIIYEQDYVLEDGKVYIPTREEQNEKDTSFKRKIASVSRKSTAKASMTNTWLPMGPSETFNPGGVVKKSSQTNIYTLSQSESNPNVLFSGSETGAVFKSVDKGLNWSAVGETFFNDGAIKVVEIDPTNESIVYVATTNNLYKTINGGNSWTALQTIGALDILAIAINPINPLIVHTAGIKGVKRSTDGGNVWTDISTEPCTDIKLKTDDPNTIFVARKNPTHLFYEIWKSTNGGLNYTAKLNGWFSPSTSSITNGGAKIGVTKADPNRVYVILIGSESADDANYVGIYRSDNAAETWSTPYDGDLNGIPDNEPGGPYCSTHWCLTTFQVTAGSGTYNQGFYNLDIDVSDINPDAFLVGALNLFKSEDGGVSYKDWGGYQYSGPADGKYRHSDQQDIEINGTDVWVATDGGIDYYDENFNLIESRNKGIDGTAYWGFDQGWNEDVLVGGRFHNGNAVHREGYGKGNFISLGGGEAPSGFVHRGNNKKVYHSDISGKLVPETFTGGVTNIPKLKKFPNQSFYLGLRSSVVTDPFYYNHLYLGNKNSLWKSEDGGISFNIIKTFGTVTANNVHSIEISRSDPNIILLTQKTGITTGKLWKSIDKGISWIEVTIPANHSKMDISLNANDELYLTLPNGTSSGSKVFKSIDLGVSWVNFTTNALSGENIYYAQVQEGTDGGVYIMSNKSIWYRNNTHTDWQLFRAGLPLYLRILKILPFYRDGKLRLAGNRGIWETDFFEASTPQVVPMVDFKMIDCSNNTVQFEDHSVVNHSGATWNWQISPAPASISDPNIRNPQVTFDNGGGAYDVTLTITQGGVDYAKTITGMVTFSGACPTLTDCGNPITLPKDEWSLVYVDSEENTTNNAAINAFDGNPNTIWHTVWSSTPGPMPHEIQIALGNSYSISGFDYLQRQDGKIGGKVKDFELYISTDNSNWGAPVYTGTFSNTNGSQNVSIAPKDGSYMRFVALSSYDTSIAFTSVAELSLAGCFSGLVTSNFTSDVTTILEGDTVNFTDTAMGNPTSWSWVFTGGTPATSTDQNPTVTYTTAGTYNVSLTTANSQGSNVKTVSDYITVATTLPQPHYKLDGDLLDASNLNINLTAVNYPAITYEGSHNGTTNGALTTAGANGYLVNTTNFYITGDTPRTVAAWIKTPAPTSSHQGIVSLGSTATASKFSLVVDNTGKLRAEVSGSSITGTSIVTGGAWHHVAVTYASGTATLYVDGVADATVSTWPTLTTASKPLVIGNEKNNLAIRGFQGTLDDVRIYAQELSAAEIADLMSIQPLVPVVDFTSDVTTTLAGSAVTFTDASSNTPTSWSWEFSGGTPATSTDQNPTVTYASAGAYEVVLTATNSGGSPDPKVVIDYITVTAPLPVGDFTSDVTTIVKGDEVHFSDSSTGVASRIWTFVGGTPAISTEKTACVSYMEAGVYEVSLTVTNTSGSDTKTITNYITVIDAQPHYRFDSNLLDSSNLNINLTAVNYPSVTYESSHNGITNGALTTVGVNGYLTSTDDFYITGDTPRTVAAWIKLQSPIATHQGIVSFGAPNDIASRFGLMVSNEGKLRAEIHGSRIVGTSIVTGGAWHHVAITYASGTATLYVDGVAENTVSNWPTLTTASGPLIVGNERYNLGIRGFRGTLDSVRIYAQELSAAQIVDLMYMPNTPAADFTSGATAVLEGEMVQFTNTSTEVGLRSWVFTGGTPATSTAQNPMVTYDIAGTYEVALTVTNADGSNTKTVTDYITVTSPSSSKESSSKEVNETVTEEVEGVTMYPNPTSSVLNIAMGSSQEKDEKISISIYSLLGQQIQLKQYKVINGKIAVDLSYLPSGSYIVIANKNGLLYRKKILKI